MATAKFLEIRKEIGDERLDFFDSRVWFLADPIEVENTFIWRQKDATRNSIQLVAQSLYSHKELNNKNTSQLQEMIFQKGINWNDYPVGMKRGRVIKKVYFEQECTHEKSEGNVLRSRWEIACHPVFTQERSFLRELIPTIASWGETPQK